jgi:dihydroorotase
MSARNTLEIINGRVVDPASGSDAPQSLFIDDGRIVGVGKAPAGFVADRTLDARGLVVAPGLIDLSARGAQSAGELRAALAGGITSLCCPPDTSPPLDEPGLVETLRHHEDVASPRVYPIGALTRGLKGEELAELAGLAAAGCIAFSQAGRPVADNRTLRRAMQYAATFGYALWLQPEDPALAADGVAHDGEVASRLGLAGIPVSAETVAIHTLIELARETGARIHLTRLSSAEGVAIVEAARRRGMNITCDVSIHSLHFIDADIGYFDANARLSPPLRSLADRDALSAAVASGVIPAICSDHTPVSEDGKLLPFGEARPGATAVDLLLPLTLAWAASHALPLAAALAPITLQAARIAGIAGGRIAEGQPADLCLFDPDAVWTPCAETLHSRGKNTPATGRPMRGRAVHTIVDGEVAYSARPAA